MNSRNASLLALRNDEDTTAGAMDLNSSKKSRWRSTMWPPPPVAVHESCRDLLTPLLEREGRTREERSKEDKNERT
jgi:hypothetical protein